MQQERRCFPAVLLLVLCTAGQDGAAAEDAIDEIQVTASRRPLAASRVSTALTIIGRDEIARETLATDALSGELGVYLQQTTSGQGAAIIRGLKGSEILHLVDGLRLNNAIFRNAPTQYLALIAPGSIERMEVVRGSPTSLYGSDAVGGVIQVISRLPQFDGDAFGLQREVAIAADSAELSKSIRASAEFGNRRAAGLVGIAHQESGNRRTGSGERIDPSGFESSSVRAAFVARPDDGQSWVVDWQFTRQPETPRVDELVPGFGQTEPSSAEFFFEPNERHFVHLRHGRDDGLWSADWTIDLGWQRIVDDRRNRDFGSNLRRFEQNRSDLFGLSVNAAREIGNASWVFGAEAYHDTVHSSRVERDLASGVETAQQSRFPDGATVAQAGIFANLSQPLRNRHTLSGGFRLATVDIELPATALSQAADLRIDDFSADIGWLTDLDAGFQVRANIGHGFRAPNVFDLGTLGERPGNRFNIPNPSLTSERVTHYDVALRRDVSHFSVDVVLYRLDYRDRIQSVLTGDTTAAGRDVVQSRNLGSAKIWGIEAGVRWAGQGPLSAELILNQTRGQQRESDGTVVPGDRIPPLNGRASLDWDWSDRLRLETTLAFAAAQERLSPRDQRDTRIDPAGTAGWFTASLGLAWRPGKVWQWNAGVDNLLDQRYRVHGSGLDAPGRNVFASVRASW